jgi:hypothetical protein|nr:MAG TPA: hypothetical protein [Caudoviricetes sp.]
MCIRLCTIYLQLSSSCKGGAGLGKQLEKAIERLKSLPRDYTYTEAKSLLQQLGYEEYNKGKTSGSRVIFIKGTHKIDLHKPHPGNEMKLYSVRDLKNNLEMVGAI